MLAELASQASGRAPLPVDTVKALFLPRPETVADVSSYLSGRGFRFVGRSGLSLEFSGSAAAAERAFSTELALYRSHGHTYRAPTSAVRLPRALARRVTSVDGLDTAVRPRPATGPIEPQVSPGPPCAGASAEAANGYLPADFAAATTGYDFQSLLDAGYDGTGEEIAFVEFSDYRPADVTTFLNCFGLPTGRVVRKTVNGGTTDRRDALEVELDLEVALAAAPDLAKAYAYVAPNPTGFATVLNRIVADEMDDGGPRDTDVHAISISWGLCEPFEPASAAAATNEALQLAAVRGISVFAASGDSGSAGCGPDAGAPYVLEPAAEPYLTAVGGTTLDVSGPGHDETVWNNGSLGGGAGGGGISMGWPMPSWQSAAGTTPDSSGAPCQVSSGYCREVPDVSLDADDNGEGYVVYCATSSCFDTGWLSVGGTSAAAPLLAAMTADANEYSLTQAVPGERLGFANPFFYDRFANDPAMFFDVVSGNNGFLGISGYDAGPGYDLASGLGSVLGAQMASDLAAYTAAPLSFDATSITATPARARTIRYGRTVTFSGQLTDTTTGTPIVGRAIWVELHDGGYPSGYGAVTDGTGNWSISLSTEISRRTSWRAYYMGEDGMQPAKSAAHLIYVVPRLAAATNLPRLNGDAVVTSGESFRFYGASAPRMIGAVMHVQMRTGSGSWRNTGIEAVANRRGRFSARLVLRGTGRIRLRWHYAGSRSRRWMSANSPGRTVRVVPYSVVGFTSG